MFLALLTCVQAFAATVLVQYDSNMTAVQQENFNADLKRGLTSGVYLISEKDADCIELECALRYAQKNAVDFVLHFKLERVQGMYFLAGDINSSKSLQSEKEIKFDATSSSELLSLINAELQPFLSMAEVTTVVVKSAPEEPEEKPEEKSKPSKQPREKKPKQPAADVRDVTNPKVAVFLGPSIIPNNPMVSSRGVTVGGQYMMSNHFGVLGTASYYPDLGMANIKGLTTTLVQIAHDGSGVSDFQQPIDKVNMAVHFDAYYQLLSVQQQGSLNGNFFVHAGLGAISMLEQYAVYDGDFYDTPVVLTTPSKSIRIPLSLGTGMVFWPTSKLGYRLRSSWLSYYAPKPQYDPELPSTESRTYSSMLVSLEIIVGTGVIK